MFIAIPFVNDAEMTIKCVDSVIKTKMGSDMVMLIPNGASDTTVKQVYDHFRTIDNGMVLLADEIRQQKNVGMAAGWNIAMEHITNSEFVCFLHNDTITFKGWLTEMKLAFDMIDGCAVSFPRQGVIGPRFATVTDTDEVYGFCFMMRRKTLIELEGFDTGYTLRPDLDMFVRAQRQGYKLVVANHSTVLHHGGGTTSDMYSLNAYTKMALEEMDKINTTSEPRF